MPAVARDRVANVLLALRVKGGPSEGAHRAAQDIARQAARDLLGPLLDTACARLGSVLRRAFDIAADVQTLAAGGCKWALTPWRTCRPWRQAGGESMTSTSLDGVGCAVLTAPRCPAEMLASVLWPCSCHVVQQDVIGEHLQVSG